MNYREAVPERWRVKYNRLTDCFHILDTWHEQVQNIADLTQDIPDNHPAVKIISGGEVNALIGELKKINRFDVPQIIGDIKTDDIISKEYISNSDIASILEKIATSLRNRKTKLHK